MGPFFFAYGMEENGDLRKNVLGLFGIHSTLYIFLSLQPYDVIQSFTEHQMCATERKYITNV